MQAAKVKVKDMVSTAKEKVREHKAKSEEKSQAKSARTQYEKEIAHEKCMAKIADARAQLNMEKAEHRAQVQEAHNASHVGTGTHHFQTVGATPAPVVTAVPVGHAASSGSNHPSTGRKYL